MIKLIIVDLGGVVVPEKWDEIRKEICTFIGCHEKEFFDATDQYVVELRKGNMTLKELYAKAVKKLNSSKKAEEVFKKHVELYKELSTTRDSAMLALIEELRINYTVVALTNTEKEIAQYHREHGLFDYFDNAFLSCDMGCAKPEPEIYKKVLQNYNCEPEEAIFIDNDEVYIEGAQQVGIHCILFENPKQLKKMLEIML